MGIPPDGVDRVINTSTAAGPLGVAGLITVGMTRAQVRAAAGMDPEIPVTTNELDNDPVRALHCGLRMAISYADQNDMNGVAGRSLSDDDIVHRITFLPGFAGHTDTGIRLGSPKSALDVPYPTDPASRVRTGLRVSGGPWEVYPGLGLSFRVVPDDMTGIEYVRAFAVHTISQGSAMPNSLNAEMRINTLRIAVTVFAGLPPPFANGSTFAYAASVLGTPPMQGYVNLGGTDIAFMNYPSLGIRLIALRNASTSVTLDQQKVSQIHLTSPFAGRDINMGRDIGLGTPQFEFDAQSNFGYLGDEVVGPYTVRVYRVASSSGQPLKMAVHFVTDECGESRADYIVLNHATL